MLNSHALREYSISHPLKIIHKHFFQSVIYHYKDDILFSDSYVNNLELMFKEVKKFLSCWSLQIAPENKM